MKAKFPDITFFMLEGCSILIIPHPRREIIVTINDDIIKVNGGFISNHFMISNPNLMQDVVKAVSVQTEDWIKIRKEAEEIEQKEREKRWREHIHKVLEHKPH